MKFVGMKTSSTFISQAIISNYFNYGFPSESPHFQTCGTKRIAINCCIFSIRNPHVSMKNDL